MSLELLNSKCEAVASETKRICEDVGLFVEYHLSYMDIHDAWKGPVGGADISVVLRAPDKNRCFGSAFYFGLSSEGNVTGYPGAGGPYLFGEVELLQIPKYKPTLEAIFEAHRQVQEYLESIANCYRESGPFLSAVIDLGKLESKIKGTSS